MLNDLANVVKILIVEDSPTQAEKLRYILEEKGYQIKVAKNGRQALDCLNKYLPTLVISDIVMPEVNGYELCKCIKTDARIRDIPVILMTTLTNKEDVFEALACGADSFITKPYSEIYILNQIEEFLTKKVLQQDEIIQVDIEIRLAGKKRMICVDLHKMFNLLLATYEAAVYKSSELFQTQDELIILNNNLENLVKEKTTELLANAVELLIANKELHFQNAEKEKRAAELIVANKELIFQNEEKEKRAAELIVANKELIFQNEEKDKRAAELILANRELVFQTGEKADRAAELVIADEELAFQTEEKADRAAELVIADEELAFQTGEKADRAAELLIANKELAYQNEEKDKRAAELIVANKELAFQNEEKEKRAVELLIANKELEKSETRNKAILEAIPDMMFITDNAGVFLDFHANQIQDLYVTPEDFMGKNITMVLPPNLAYFLLERIALISKTGMSYLHEYSLMTENKEQFYEARMVPCDERSVMTIVRNITDKKKSDQKILEQIEYLTVIHEIDNIVLESQDFVPSLKVILLQVLKKLKADAGVVFTIESQTMAIKYATSLGISEKGIEQIKLHDFMNLAREAVNENKTIFVPDVSRSAEKITLIDVMSEEGFVSTVIVPLFAKQNNIGVLQIFNRNRFEEGHDWMDSFNAFGSQIAIAIDSANAFSNLKRSNDNLIQAYDETIKGWSRGMDLRDRETEGHSLRVTEMTLILAKEFGMNKTDLVNVRRGALLHDMGKLGIPDSILLKPGKLTDEEWVIMRQHPQFAVDMLGPIDYLRPALDIPFGHHEKWDGSGYPQGLKGKQIPLAARLFAVVDVWDALRSDRPYRAAWSKEKVLEHIQAGSGSHFDPEIVEIFIKIMV